MADNTINNDLTLAGATATVLVGRYRVVRPLGQGGMGSVWLAEDTQLDNRPVAIKMLPAILVSNKRAYNQLKAEALVSLKLTHPNIAAVRAFEENNGNPFLVVDYIDGQTLDDYLAEKGKLSEGETVRLLAPIADALDYAHTKGVIHRDVKPGNVMIAKDGTPYILDFGIAREIQETLTRVTGKLSSGTLMYMGPEQLDGNKPTVAQDVYSFSAMAYECLAGEPPFCRGAIEDQIRNKIPAALDKDIAIGNLVLAGLAKGPDERPAMCAGVLAEAGTRQVAMMDRAVGRRVLGKKHFLLAACLGVVLLFVGLWGWPRGKRQPMTESARIASVERIAGTQSVTAAPERVVLEAKRTTAISATAEAQIDASVKSQVKAVLAEVREEERRTKEEENRVTRQARQNYNQVKAIKDRIDSYFNDSSFSQSLAVLQKNKEDRRCLESVYAEVDKSINVLLEIHEKAQTNSYDVAAWSSLESAASSHVSVVLKSAREVERLVANRNEARNAWAYYKEGYQIDAAKCQVSEYAASYIERIDKAAQDVREALAAGDADKAASNADVVKGLMSESLTTAKKGKCDFHLKICEQAVRDKDWERCLRNAELVLDLRRNDSAAVRFYNLARYNIKPSLIVSAKIRGIVTDEFWVCVDGCMKKYNERWQSGELQCEDQMPAVRLYAEKEGRTYVGEVGACKVDWIGPKLRCVELSETRDPRPGVRRRLKIGGVEFFFVWCPARSERLQGFWVLENEVTQEQWSLSEISVNPYFRGERKPVDRVSLVDCRKFVEVLNQKLAQKSKYRFRLLTSDEWKWAAGGAEVGWKYARARPAGSVSPQSTSDVGTGDVNGLGLYDMLGNVGEWCADGLIAGGDWYRYDSSAGFPTREMNESCKDYYTGFRLALTEANGSK